MLFDKQAHKDSTAQSRAASVFIPSAKTFILIQVNTLNLNHICGAGMKALNAMHVVDSIKEGWNVALLSDDILAMACSTASQCIRDTSRHGPQQGQPHVQWLLFDQLEQREAQQLQHQQLGMMQHDPGQARHQNLQQQQDMLQHQGQGHGQSEMNPLHSDMETSTLPAGMLARPARPAGPTPISAAAMQQAKPKHVDLCALARACFSPATGNAVSSTRAVAAAAMPGRQQHTNFSAREGAVMATAKGAAVAAATAQGGRNTGIPAVASQPQGQLLARGARQGNVGGAAGEASGSQVVVKLPRRLHEPIRFPTGPFAGGASNAGTRGMQQSSASEQVQGERTDWGQVNAGFQQGGGQGNKRHKVCGEGMTGQVDEP